MENCSSRATNSRNFNDDDDDSDAVRIGSLSTDRSSGPSRWKAAKVDLWRTLVRHPPALHVQNRHVHVPRRDGAVSDCRAFGVNQEPYHVVPAGLSPGRDGQGRIAGWTVTSTGEAFGRCSRPPFFRVPLPHICCVDPFCACALGCYGLEFLNFEQRQTIWVRGTQKEGKANIGLVSFGFACERSVSRRRGQQQVGNK